MRPPEDEPSAGEDELLAQVIPLRRREDEREADLSPITPHGRAPTGVFDPPEDPEPADGYSVWEQPIAELIRRGEPEPTRARTQSQAARIARRPRILLATATAAALCSVIALGLSGWLAGAPSHPLRAPAAAHVSVSQGAATSDSPGHSGSPDNSGPRARRSAGTSTLRHTHAASRPTSSRRSSQPTTTHTSKQAPASSSPPGSSDTASPGYSQPTAPAQVPPTQATAASVQPTASHEFGFER